MDWQKLIDATTNFAAEVPRQAVFGLIFVGLLLVLFAAIVSIKRSGERRRTINVDRRAPGPVLAQYSALQPSALAAPPPVPRQEISLEIIETTSLNGFGGLCSALMILTWVVSVVFFFVANSSIHEAVALMIWIGGNTMFGIGALLNRERKYRVSHDRP